MAQALGNLPRIEKYQVSKSIDKQPPYFFGK